METINLLPNKSRLQLKQLKTIQRFNLGAIILLITFSFASLVAISLNFYLNREVGINREKLRASQAEFSQFLGKLDELQNLRFRAKLVAQTLKGRSLVNTKIDAVEKLLGEEAQIEYLQIKDENVELRARLFSLVALEELEEKLKSQGYQVMELENLSVEENGGLPFVLKIKFREAERR